MGGGVGGGWEWPREATAFSPTPTCELVGDMNLAGSDSGQLCCVGFLFFFLDVNEMQEYLSFQTAAPFILE